MPLSSLPRPLWPGVVFLAIASSLACDGGSRRTVAARSDDAPALGVAAAIGAQLEPARSRRARPRAGTLAAFYAARRFRPVWSEGDELLPAAERLVATIAASEERGLDPARYQVERLERRVLTCRSSRHAHPTIHRRRLAECDLLLSRAFLEFSRDLAVGRMSARRAGIRWHTAPRQLNLSTPMLEAARSGRIEPALEKLELRHAGYVELKRALAAMREIEARGGWAALPESPKELMADPRWQAKLRTRLAAAGDLGAGAAGEAELLTALRRFQARHGLEASGKIDAATLAELNVPAAERRRQIELNLERWRWLPESLGERYVLVNVPAYELELVERGERRLAMRVVVGKPYQQTPAFSDVIERLELNPYWNVPPSIVRAEIVPAIRADPAYLAKENMEVVSEDGERLEVRQRPGPGNALGKIKFVLPNEHNIYLHDTPAEELFDRTARSFSHGCIRLEAPLDLAERLLAAEPGWNRRRLEEEIATGANRFVRLSNPVPVHILYWTAWVDERGELQLRRDPYDVDAKLARALRRG